MDRVLIYILLLVVSIESKITHIEYILSSYCAWQFTRIGERKMSKTQMWIINYYAAPPKMATMFRHICFAQELERVGYEVRIFAASTIHNTNLEIDLQGKDFLEIEYEGVKFVHIKTKKYSSNGVRRMHELWSFPRKIAAICHSFAPPEIILHSAFVPLDTSMHKIARKFGAKYLVEIHDLWPASFVAYGLLGKSNILLPFLYREEHRLYHLADQLIFTMEGGKDYIREKGWDKAKKNPVSLLKVHNINQGIDLATYESDSEKTYPDSDLDRTDKFKVVYVGSIRLANNLTIIMDIAEELKKRGRMDVVFLIFGDGDRRESLEKECFKKDLANVVFKGRVSPSVVPAILKKASLMLFNFGETELARFGLSPNKLFLYFAGGKPVLSTIRPAYDLVERYHAGKSVANDPISIANGILSIADCGKAEYNEYCEGAKKAAVDYDYRNLTKKLLAIMEPTILS